MEAIEISSVLAGSVKPLGVRGVPSGIDKRPVNGAARFEKLGFIDDDQGDKKVHGGVDKAVHHYPFDHYRIWADELQIVLGEVSRPSLNEAGAFGENISTVGLTEQEVCLGDIFQLGSGVVQVSQGRQPCWKLNERFGIKTMARRVQKTGRTGWYYRVLDEGVVCAGDQLRLKERLAASWTLARVQTLLYEDVKNFAALEELHQLPFLAESWRQLAERRLAKSEVEDWTARLDGA